MRVPAPFAARRHEIGALVIEPLDAREAPQLGAAFAAIDPWARYPYPASALEAYLAAAEASAPRFALKLGAETVGALGLRLDWLRGPYVQFLGLLPPFQRHGLGAVVIDWIVAEGRRSGERNAWVIASDFNSDAIRFYERHGFAPIAALPDLVVEGRVELLLRKRL